MKFIKKFSYLNFTIHFLTMTSIAVHFFIFQVCALYDLRESTASKTPSFRHSTATQFVDRYPTSPIIDPLVRISFDGATITCRQSRERVDFWSIPRSLFSRNDTSSMRCKSSQATSAAGTRSSPAENSWKAPAQGWSTGDQSPPCLDLVHSIDRDDICELAFCPGSSLVVTVNISGRLCWFLPRN